MVGIENVVKVQSLMNPWIDFIVVINNPSEMEVAKTIIQDSYDGWFSAMNETDEPMADYISRRLREVCINHEIYFKEQEERDDE